jgi:hypothetical protein
MDALRLRMAIKTVLAAQHRPESPSLHLHRGVDHGRRAEPRAAEAHTDAGQLDDAQQGCGAPEVDGEGASASSMVPAGHVINNVAPDLHNADGGGTERLHQQTPEQAHAAPDLSAEQSRVTTTAPPDLPQSENAQLLGACQLRLSVAQRVHVDISVAPGASPHEASGKSEIADDDGVGPDVDSLLPDIIADIAPMAHDHGAESEHPWLLLAPAGMSATDRASAAKDRQASHVEVKLRVQDTVLANIDVEPCSHAVADASTGRAGTAEQRHWRHGNGTPLSDVPGAGGEVQPPSTCGLNAYLDDLLLHATSGTSSCARIAADTSVQPSRDLDAAAELQTTESAGCQEGSRAAGVSGGANKRMTAAEGTAACGLIGSELLLEQSAVLLLSEPPQAAGSATSMLITSAAVQSLLEELLADVAMSA